MCSMELYNRTCIKLFGLVLTQNNVEDNQKNESSFDLPGGTLRTQIQTVLSKSNYTRDQNL